MGKATVATDRYARRFPVENEAEIDGRFPLPAQLLSDLASSLRASPRLYG